MITLKPQHFKDSKRIITTDELVSNGAWAIKKEHVANSPMFQNEATCAAFMPSASFGQTQTTWLDLFNGKERKEYTRTNILIDAEMQIRAYYNEELNDVRFFNTAYLKTLDDPEILYGSPNTLNFADAKEAAESLILIMPVTADARAYEPFHL